MIGSRSNLVRLVELVERNAHKDVRLEINVGKDNTTIGVFKATRNGKRYVIATHSGAPTRDIEELAFDVMEDLAEEAVKQGITYKSVGG